MQMFDKWSEVCQGAQAEQAHQKRAKQVSAHSEQKLAHILSRILRTI